MRTKTKPSGAPLWVVTGISGMLGANFALAAGKRSPAVGFYGAHRVHFPHVDCRPLDLASRSATEEALASVCPSVVFHFAAATNVDWCEEHATAARQINTEGTKYIAEWAAHHGALLVYMSTDSVFDGRSGGYSEAAEPNPINVYCQTKLDGESCVRSLCREHLIVRANLFGWSPRAGSGLAEWMLSRLEKGGVVPGFSDVLFSPLLVNDLIDLIFMLVEKGARGLWHLACREPVTKLEFGLEMARCFGLDEKQCKPGSVQDACLRAKRPLNTSLNARRASAFLQVPMPRLRCELERFRCLRTTGYVDRLRSAYTNQS